MLPQQRCKKPHLKPTSEFHSIALKWKRDVPTAAVLGRRHWGGAVGPRHAGTPVPCQRRAGETWRLPAATFSPAWFPSRSV